mgnify:CR=1 FL=1
MISVNIQYIKDLSFENPNAPKSISNQEKPPEINVDVNVSAKPLNKNIFEVSLSLSAKAKNDKFVVFEAELIYCGVFTIPDNVDESATQKLVLIEGPKLLFPFARSILADITRDGGFLPLIIQPIDFNALFENRLKVETSTKGSA